MSGHRLTKRRIGSSIGRIKVLANRTVATDACRAEANVLIAGGCPHTRMMDLRTVEVLDGCK